MLWAYEMGEGMEGKGLDNINATYLRQIEGGTKVPSQREIAAAMIRAALERKED